MSGLNRVNCVIMDWKRGDDIAPHRLGFGKRVYKIAIKDPPTLLDSTC